jgi:large subunit ribosomal protein L10
MRPEKVWIVQNLKSLAESQAAMVMTDYTGLSAAAIAQLRSRLKEVSASYVVVKDRLLRLAVKEVTGVDVDPVNQGPTGVAYGADPVSLAKVLKTFSIENEAFKVKAGLLKNRLLNKVEIGELAKIPPKAVLIAQLLGILNRPISDLVYVLKANLVGLVMVLARVKEQKEQSEKSNS